ncbi:30S ribosomal protein S12 methylthiotransferase RimO [Dactylosporangium aurantiacum]|uniref:Ribosomal protein uS12 methylthiotransferase RimO n=1 Tax=Dactylosporangium aurantiacum TaxID=35754 RepID=A0A9Q9IHF0_9ACTN|nr:30S ribosomal protein S12 methylthiotransferase RimO [Dactylosporangium aurantiacum]MDG6104535.1 30S ribosomal protein S12 methylthiotransferase RimO [Dactylosporangium aurantiacum]UWZ56147.1 30S ribosomal protein S12 methylthiotransferase RimO [Dactylosporangium aurantiacum]
MPTNADRRVALLTLGCARNEVDSEELAARLAAGGWSVTTDGTDADVVVVNTCGFVAKAKQDSIDTLLAAADTGAKVVATGCLAERYGEQLAGELPEADAVLGFDHYPDMAARLDAILAGETIASHAPRDRRTLLPLTPVARQAAAEVVVPGHGAGNLPAHLRGVMRQRLESGPVAPLKLASGCDRRCTFCAIPSFRGAFVSRTPDEVLAEAEWLASSGVRELVLVSENSTSYGKDLGDPRLLERLLPQLAAVRGIVRVRVSYLQPAETRPGLVEAIATTPGVAPYFDLSFQHSSEPVLRRMRRFGSTERFLELLESVRRLDPDAGARSNVIVGFPGETREDVDELARFLTEARLDAVGVFDYSDEDGTEAADLPDKVSESDIKKRYDWMSALAEELCAQRAADRIGSHVDVLVDDVLDDSVEGRAAHQAPEVDGSTTLVGGDGLDPFALRRGDLVRAKVVDSVGVDLVAVPIEMISPADS